MIGYKRQISTPTLRTSLWQAHPESVARAVAIALFLVFLPLPLHALSGAAACVVLRANIPVMLVLIWINNPLTLIPILLFSLVVGQRILGQDPISLPALSLQQTVQSMFSNMTYESFIDFVVPLFVGSTLIGATLAAVGYFLTHFLWGIVRTRLARTATEQ